MPTMLLSGVDNFAECPYPDVVPDSLLAFSNAQTEPKRHVLHLLHFIPERKGSFDVIEQAIPLYNLEVTINSSTKPALVGLVPQQQVIAFQYNDQLISLPVTNRR